MLNHELLTVLGLLAQLIIGKRDLILNSPPPLPVEVLSRCIDVVAHYAISNILHEHHFELTLVSFSVQAVEGEGSVVVAHHCLATVDRLTAGQAEELLCTGHSPQRLMHLRGMVDMLINLDILEC